MSEVEFVDAVCDGVRYFAFRICLSVHDAEDMYQEGLLKVIEVFRKYAGGVDLKQLCRIAGRSAENRMRDLQRAEISRLKFLDRFARIKPTNRYTEPVEQAAYNESLERLLRAAGIVTQGRGTSASA